MNRRALLIVLSFTCFGVSLAAVLRNQHRLNEVRSEHGFPTGQQEIPAGPASLEVDRSEIPGGDRVSPEVLRLRAEVTRLSMRKRELESGVVPAAAIKNPGSGVTVVSTNVVALPLGYIRKSKAQFVGYSTPENTLESMLWAIQNRDTNGVLQSFSKELAQHLAEKLSSESGSHDFFKEADVLPGLFIRSKEQEQEGEVKLKVEIIPDMPAQEMKLSLVNGEWKIGTGF